MPAPAPVDPPGPIRRVVVLDEHRMFTDALALALSAEPDLRVVDRCAVSDPDVLRRVAAGRPDVVVVDVEPAAGRTAELVAGLLATHGQARVLVLTGRRDPHRLVDAVRAGAAGWLTKDCSPGELLAGLVDGAGGAQIAAALQVSEGTVRTHLHKVFGKLGVHSRLEAVSVARAAGMWATMPVELHPDGRS